MADRSFHTKTARAVMLVGLVAILSLPAAPVAAQRACHYFEFEKGSNLNSTLYWHWVDEFGRCIYSDNWRAGSGTTEDPCQKNKGWLPNGWYDLWGHYNEYNGNSIRGRAWHFQDKWCSGGEVQRTELFIHTEETRYREQVCSSDPDDPWCWDGTPNGDATADHSSEGCIKVRRSSPEHDKPNAMGSVHQRWHDFGGPDGHGAFTSTDRLWVRG